MYGVYLCSHDFILNEFIEGQIVGVFFLAGSVFSTVAFNTGPGGPINALIMTQILYQTTINAIFFG